MRAEEVVALVGHPLQILREPAHGAEEAGRRVGIEAGRPAITMPDLSAAKLLRLAEGGKAELGLVGALVGRGVAAEHAGHHLVDEVGGLGPLVRACA